MNNKKERKKKKQKPDLIHCFIIWACDRNETFAALKPFNRILIINHSNLMLWQERKRLGLPIASMNASRSIHQWKSVALQFIQNLQTENNSSTWAVVCSAVHIFLRRFHRALCAKQSNHESTYEFFFGFFAVVASYRLSFAPANQRWEQQKKLRFDANRWK